MSFDCTLNNMRRELCAAEQFRDRHLTNLRGLIERFTGTYYMDGSTTPDDLENFSAQYVALMLPRLVYDNPKVDCVSSRPMVQADVATRMGMGLDRWTRMVNLRRTLERLATDFLLLWGVSLTVMEPVKGNVDASDSEPWLPRVYRLDPTRFFIDPAASSYEDARYAGHCWLIDKDDLIAKAKSEDGWNVEAVENIGVNSGVDETRSGGRTTAYGQDGNRDIPNRNEVAIYEIWLPEVKEEDREKFQKLMDDEFRHIPNKSRPKVSGTIYTVLKYQGGQGKEHDEYNFVRDPRPYMGPSEGPYCLFGAFTVPNDPYPLSPVVNFLPQSNDLNSHLRAIQWGAKTYKRIILVNSRNLKLAQDVSGAGDQTVVVSDDVDPSQIVNVEIGGFTAQQAAYAKEAQMRLDRDTGVDEAMRGATSSGDTTATEASIAASAATVRVSHIAKQFSESVNRVLEKVAWFLFYDDKISFPIGGEAIEKLGEVEPVFNASAMVGAFEDLDIQIQAYSMERTNEGLQQRRALEAVQILGNLIPMMQAAPGLGWKKLVTNLGNVLNMPDFSQIVTPQALSQMTAQNQAEIAQGQQGQPQQTNGMVRPAQQQFSGAPASKFERRSPSGAGG